MARPRHDAPGPTARERLEDAFWTLLTEKKYTDITVNMLSRRAGVNHNTFYYYYDSLTQMTEKLVESTVTPEVPSAILSSLANGTFRPEVMAQFVTHATNIGKIITLVADDSAPWIARLVQRRVMTMWLESIRVDPEDLEPTEKMILTFMVGGAIALLSSFDGDVEPSLVEVYDRFIHSGLLDSAGALLMGIATSHGARLDGAQ